MRHSCANRKLSRTTKHRQALMRNLVIALFENSRIVTTVPKAKEARRYAERVITYGKKSLEATEPAKKLHFRRLAMTALHNKDAVDQLIEKVAPTYKDRQGGYTRILRAGYRLGDNGEKAIFELV